jgi:metal-sulfur cluster biosynthetic enzyme
MPLNEDRIREQLKNIVDLGLVYLVDVEEPNESGKHDVKIDMTMTSPMCPAGPQLVADCQRFVSQLEGVGNVDVRVVMDPPWTQDMMSDDARDQLGIF